MSNKILVTYSSFTGSTEGVAKKITEVLKTAGLDVEIAPMDEVIELDKYGTVIAGSPIQAQKWLPEAMQFLHKNREILSGKTIVTFTVCMALAIGSSEKYKQGVSEWLKPVRDLINPIDEGIFAGILNIKLLPNWSDRLKFRISVLLGVWKEGDHRNWNAISSWTDGVRAKLHLG